MQITKTKDRSKENKKMERAEFVCKALKELVKQVDNNSSFDKTCITYKELSKRIEWFNKKGEPHCRSGKHLGKMWHLLLRIEKKLNLKEIPHITTLVVGQELKIPSAGVLYCIRDGKLKKELDPSYVIIKNKKGKGKGAAVKAAAEQIRKLLRREYQKIKEFHDWKRLIKILEKVEQQGKGKSWEQIENILDEILDEEVQKVKIREGESPEHKGLKDYICNHPESVGAEGEGETEYFLPSGDSIDVVIKNPKEWTCVEVKSRHSDHSDKKDYRRGLFQCLKYGTVVKAMYETCWEEPGKVPPKSIRMVLALEKKLPRKWKKLKCSLNQYMQETCGHKIEIYEDIKVPQPKNPRTQN